MKKKQLMGVIGVAAAVVLIVILAIFAGKGCGKGQTDKPDATVSEIGEGNHTGGKDDPNGQPLGSGEIVTNEAGNELIEGVDENGNPVIIEIDPEGEVVGVEPNGETVNVPTERETEQYHAPSNPVPDELEDGYIRVTNAEGEFIKDVDPDELVDPGKDTLEEEKIKNFQIMPGTIEEGSNVIEKDRLEIHSGGVYTGVYIEGGEDIYLDNVVALLVTNTSEDMLQVLRFSMHPKDHPEEEMVFQVTDLPAGATALIFELGKRQYVKDDVYTLGEEIHTFYAKETVAGTKQFSVEIVDGLMKLTNLTDKSFDRVYVHYKYLQEGGSYFGGIAYRSAFNSVGPKESVTTGAGHFTEKVSQIVLIEGTESEQ